MKQTMMKQLCFSALFFLAACSGATSTALPGKIKELSWLMGRWEDKSEQGMLSETWKALNDSTYTAETYYETQGDTVFAEKIRLEEHRNGIAYIPVVSDQDGGKPVTFRLTSSGRSRAVFENKRHDFPRKLVYELIGDSIRVTISGMEKGVPKTEEFVMHRSD